jgi:hypothetical protein
MNWNAGWLIAGVLLLASGCSGPPPEDAGPAGDVSPSGNTGTGGGGTASGGTGTGGGGFAIGLGDCSANSNSGGVGRIWVGETQDGETEEMRLLIAETGEFRWLPGDGWYQQVFGTFQADTMGVSSTDAVRVWVDGLTFLETSFVSVDMWGTLTEQGSLSIQYQSNSNPSHAGTYSLAACDSVYMRESSLAILAGTYTGLKDTYSLAIDSRGAMFYQNSRTGCVGNGSAELIDPGFNMYRVEIEIENCTAQLAVELNGLTFTGLGYLGDSGDGDRNDVAALVLSTVRGGRYVMWDPVAQR